MLSFLDLAAKLRPRWIVWENVPGVLSSGQPRGSDFATFLQGLVERGYGWAYRVLDAQHFGVPQRRRRVFVVASLGGRDVASSVLLEPESVCWNPTPRRKKGQEAAANSDRSLDPRGCWWDGGQVSQTLDAVLQKGQTMPEKNRFPAVLQLSTYDMKQHHNPQPSDNVQLTTKNCASIRGDTPLVQPAMAVRRLTPTECERLQGFPDNWSRIPWKGKLEDQCPDGPRYKACGNSMAVPVMRWIGEQIARVEAEGK